MVSLELALHTLVPPSMEQNQHASKSKLSSERHSYVKASAASSAKWCSTFGLFTLPTVAASFTSLTQGEPDSRSSGAAALPHSAS